MKSSTIRRSTLSKESMEVIENLVKQQDTQEDGVGEYIRPVDYEENSSESSIASKAQEIDLLWQNFKSTQFNSNSPTAYILLGAAVGVVVALVLTFSTGYYLSKSGKLTIQYNSVAAKSNTLEQDAATAQDVVEAKVSVPSEDEISTKPVVGETAKAVDSASADVQKIDQSKMKKYVVKSGDTGESIIKHYYGSYSPEKAELIKKVNNLDSLDRINIDQELLIPME